VGRGLYGALHDLGLAVTIVTLCAALVVISLAAAFGVPLVNGITHLAHRMPGYVASAQHGNGWIGHLVARYHVQSWVQRNTPKLTGYAQSLAKPALTVGKGAVSLIIELVTLFVLVLLLLLEGPKTWNWTLAQMTPGRRAAVTRVAGDVSQKVTGYMVGNLLTSLIAGTVVFVTLQVLGVPFPLLWGLWVALVDFLPMIGGALLAIPTAGALQVPVKEVWQATAPDQPRESPVPAAEPADESGDPVAQHRPHPTVQAGDLN
jgi:predicted PurR-regulated permease PerM